MSITIWCTSRSATSMSRSSRVRSESGGAPSISAVMPAPDGLFTCTLRVSRNELLYASMNPRGPPRKAITPSSAVIRTTRPGYRAPVARPTVVENVFDPRMFARGVPHEALRRLRDEVPVSWQEEHEVGIWPAGPGYWAVTRYDDVRHVLRSPADFSSSLGA